MKAEYWLTQSQMIISGTKISLDLNLQTTLFIWRVHVSTCVYVSVRKSTCVCVWFYSVCICNLGVNFGGHFSFTIHFVFEESFPDRIGAYHLGKAV